MGEKAGDAGVVVTGVGVISSLGLGREELARALDSGRVGIDDATLFEPPGACEHAAEIPDFDWHEYIFSKQTYADRTTQLGVAAARLALEDAGLRPPLPAEHADTGICLGTCWGCVDSCERFFQPLAQGKPKSASSLVFSHSYPNCPTSFIAIEMGLRGYSTSFAGSRLAGIWALESALRAVHDPGAGPVLAGGVDSLAPVVVGHLEAVGELPDTRGRKPAADTPQFWGRVPGEAAVFLVLEEAGRARGRGARVLATLAGATPGRYAVGEAPTVERLWQAGDTMAAAPLLDLAAHIARGRDEAELAGRDLLFLVRAAG